MRISTAILIAAAFLLPFELAAATVHAQQAAQKHRIHQGIISGTLTKKEASRLLKQQQAIARKEELYRADGVLTRWERNDLKTDLYYSSHNIRAQKHDWQER